MRMTRYTETIEIITCDQSRPRSSAAEKVALVRKTYEPGINVSLVTRQEDISASLLLLGDDLSAMAHWSRSALARLSLRHLS